MDKLGIEADESLIAGTSTPIKVNVPKSSKIRKYRVKVTGDSNEEDPPLQNEEFTLHPDVDSFVYQVSAPMHFPGDRLKVQLSDESDPAQIAEAFLEVER